MPAENTFLRLVLQGKAPNAVLLSSLRVRVLERRAPLVGTPLWCGLAAGAAELRFVYLDLDRSPAVGVRAELTDDMRVVERAPLAFTLKQHETEVFDIWAKTMQCYCKWVIELDLVVNGRQVVKTVTNNGSPFQTTASPGTPLYLWHAGTWHLNGETPQPLGTPLRPLH